MNEFAFAFSMINIAQFSIIVKIVLFSSVCMMCESLMFSLLCYQFAHSDMFVNFMTINSESEKSVLCDT